MSRGQYKLMSNQQNNADHVIKRTSEKKGEEVPNLKYSQYIAGNNKWCAGMMNLKFEKTYARFVSAVMRI